MPEQKYSDMVNQRRNEMIDVVLSYMEQNPTEWQSGWQKFGCPINAASSKPYRGINLLYLTVVSMARKYTDNRWVTFNQAKQLGASVKKGEKAVPVLYYSIYDENTKKDFDPATVADMTQEERIEYEKKYVRAYTKFYQVFNAEQCVNMPEREVKSMDEAERQRQNELVERIIANSAAPVLYDGGDSAYYSLSIDDIHLPLIEQFNTMQDYYATALHEIGHSTGHSSRLNRDMSGSFGSEKYALEELRAELSSMFLQMENGIELEGRHIQNHSVYLTSWLKVAKDNKTAFTSAVKDAMKIADYINEHYNVAAAARSQDDTNEKAAIATRYAILAAAMRVANEDMSYVDAKYIDPYVDRFFSERNRLKKQVEVNGVAPSLDPTVVQSALDEYANPLVIEYYGWYDDDVKKAIAHKIEDPALQEHITKLAYNYDSLQDNTPVSESNPMLTVEAQQHYYYTGSNTMRNQQEGFTILHDRERDKWYLWNSDFIEGKVITYTGTRERLTIGQSAKKSEILRTFDNEKELVSFDSKEQAREYWERESAKIAALREQYHEINSVTAQRQAELDSLMLEKSALFSENTKENATVLAGDDKHKKEIAQADVSAEPIVLQPDSRFAEQVDAVLSGADTVSTHLKVMDTPFLLRQVGAPNLPILMTAKHLKTTTQESGNESVNYHGIDVDTIKRLPELLSDPVMIMDSLTRDDSIVVVTETTDKLNRPVIGAMRLGRGNFDSIEIDANILTSVYGRRNFENFIRRTIDAGKMLYLSKEKSQTLLNTPGIQFPDNIKHVDSNTIIRKSNAFVNAQTQNSSKKDETVSRTLPNVDEQQQTSTVSKQPTEQVAATVSQVDKTQNTELAAEQEAKEQQAQQTVENVEQQQPSVKKTQEISHTSWTKFAIDEQQIGPKYDKSTMIKLPDTAQLKCYVVFVPSKIVRKDKQGCFVSLKGDMNFTIKNDGMEMKVTASELASLLQGKDIGKEPLRVAPKKINKDRIEALDKNLPSELKELKQWCAFTTYREDDGSYKKKNIDVHSGQKKDWAKANDPTTWTDFKTAKQYALDNNCAGLTIVLTPESGVTCIDLDKCIDDAGNVSEFAQKVLKATEGTYAEKSVSGHGIHIFVKGDLLENGKYKNVSSSKEAGTEMEVYNQSKFISLTGDVIGTSAQKLDNIKPAQLAALHELMDKRPTVNTKKNVSTVRTATADVVEQRILRSTKKNDYQRLMAGDSLSGGDHSKDDFKLLNILAFFSDCDPNVMREIFMRSRLYREEGGVGNKKSTGYLDTSIKNAINSLANRPRGFADKEQQSGLFNRRNKSANAADNGDGGGTGGNGAGAENSVLFGPIF